MSWFWKSYEEFKEWVQPLELDRPNFFYSANSSIYTRRELVLKLNQAVERFTKALSELRGLGLNKDNATEADGNLQKGETHIWDLVYSGEEMMLLQKRLAKSRWAEDFLHEKDLDEHWDRYSKTRRIYDELDKFILASEKLLEGYYDFLREDEDFLIRNHDIPAPFDRDFLLARNLYSVGYEEIGTLIAGRGLEGILREVARIKKLHLIEKNKKMPAAEIDFYDLIELIYRTKWRKDKSRLIEKRTKDLLHFLRNIRNSSAHPNDGQIDEGWEDIARIVVREANLIWSKACSKRTRVLSTEIIKEW